MLVFNKAQGIKVRAYDVHFVEIMSYVSLHIVAPDNLNSPLKTYQFACKCKLTSFPKGKIDLQRRIIHIVYYLSHYKLKYDMLG